MEHQPKSQEFVKSLALFFKRELISIPLIQKYPHHHLTQRCGLKAATLELDTTSFPNIEYIAGNRLSVYPVNPTDHVNFIMNHLKDDISPISATNHANQRKKIKLSDPWAKFVQLNGKDSLRLALVYLYDITTAPSRDLLRIMAENCSNKEHKKKLIALNRDDDSWEKWLCQSLRTLKSTLEEFNSCSMSAKSLFSELPLQQPRQYSLSSIKSNKRFRTEIIVFQHKFNAKQIKISLQNIKERERSLQLEGKSKSPTGSMSTTHQPVHVNHNESRRSSNSVRSLRSMAPVGISPITTQQVRRVPNYSGPLMSMYALSSINNTQNATRSSSRLSQLSTRSGKSLISAAANDLTSPSNSISTGKNYDGLCSNYLLNLNPNDYIVCEFVENPRFTLKGNRERPIMMIGQDVGVVAYRAFWQQRSLEHDRAQIFYTLFKDLSPKKFGDMQLICLTGNRCKVEDLFKREISSVLTNKILSSVSYISKQNLLSLLDTAAMNSQTSINSQLSKLPIDTKELVELGNRISKLLIESNGCLYTCCDAQMTQAIEMLAAESIAKNSGMARDRIMALLPRLKGRKTNNEEQANNKFLFTLENPFERAQIVQEIYDSSI